MKKIYLTKNHLTILLVFLLLWLFLFPFGSTAGAEGAQETFVEETGEGSGFEIRAILPANQQKNISYFHLRMEPLQQQTLEVLVTSTSLEEIDLYLWALNGQSTPTGTIDYFDTTQLDETIPIPFTDIAKLEETKITLQPYETKTVSLFLEMPKETYDGVILGGIKFIRFAAPPKEDADVFQLQNNFAHLLGVVLYETDTPLSSDFQFVEAKAEVLNYNPSFVFSLLNPMPLIEKDLELTTEIYKDGKVYQAIEKVPVSFAPTSRMDFSLPQEGSFVPGDYTAHIQLQREDEIWEFDGSFKISGTETTQLQKEAQPPQQSIWNMMGTYIVLTIAALLFLEVLGIFFYRKFKNKK